MPEKLKQRIAWTPKPTKLDEIQFLVFVTDYYSKPHDLADFS